jgi:hypothetical protein
MIFRRLTTALRKQDWFTVMLKTLIAVPDVLPGIRGGQLQQDAACRGG